MGAGLGMRVSILVLMEVPLRVSKHTPIGENIGVSILVLMEVPLRVNYLICKKTDIKKFQSLF